MAGYQDLINTVGDWANRDSSVLSDNIIADCLRYAADEAYRKLEIPPLEQTTFYIIDNETITYTDEDDVAVTNPANINQGTRDRSTLAQGISNASIPVPSDAVSFIHLRVRGEGVSDDNAYSLTGTAASGYTPMTTNNRLSGIVYNEKTDVRTFYDFFADKTSFNYWTRHGNDLLLAGDIDEGLVLELYYYRRLPALNATTDGMALAADESNLAANWLRDQNERVLLFGALFRVFDYLQEDDQAQKYQARFIEAIAELNDEERNRRGSGGNVQMNYNGFGHI